MIAFKQLGICVFESALFRTTSTVIETEKALIIVDPNWLPEEISSIQKYVDTVRQDRTLFLLFTHSDYDHIIGYKAFPEAQVISSQAFVDNPDKEKILQQIRDFDEEYYIRRTYDIEYPKVDIVAASDHQKIKSGDSTLTFFQAPGHNIDGIFTLIEPQGILLAGDYLSDIEFPYIYHSSIAYEESLKKLEALIFAGKIKLLIPGHGKATKEVQEMQKRLQDSYHYIELLRNCVKNGKDFPLDELWKQYDFPGVMTRFHQGNEKLIEEELKNY